MIICKKCKKITVEERTQEEIEKIRAIDKKKYPQLTLSYEDLICRNCGEIYDSHFYPEHIDQTVSIISRNSSQKV